MAYSEERVKLIFNADTKAAKSAMQDLQNNLNQLFNSTMDFKFGESITQEVKQSQQALLQLSQSLNSAMNVNTGKLDLSKFKESMDASGMSIQKYHKLLTGMGAEGQQAFSKLALQIQKAEIPLKRTGKLANELWTTLKNTARWQLSASLLQGFTGAIQKAYRYSQDLNESLNNIRIVTGKSVEDMARFAVEANKSAKALSTTTTEYTNASLIYYQQGLSTQEVKERTDVTIKMANVARESAESISDQMTAVWNNFADGSRTLEYYADVMTALGAATASSTAEITTGLEKFAAVAETVGLSYEYATTALATITDTTRQSADVVGNALKTLFARIQGLSLGETLEDGTDLNKYSEALAKVGISIKEQDGSLKEMDAILEEMAAKWQVLNDDQQVALAQTVAGVRQYTQLVALMDNWDKFQINLEVAQNAEGELSKQQEIYAEGWEAARDRVTASLETIYQKLLDDEFLVDLTNGFGDFLDLVSDLIDSLGGLPGVLSLVGVAFTKIFNKQMSAGLNNMVYSIKMMTKSGRDSITNQKVATADMLMKQADRSGSDADTGAAQAYRAQGEAMKDFVLIQEQLTDEQRQQYQYLLDMQATYVDKVAQGTEELHTQKLINDELHRSLELKSKQVFTPGQLRGNGWGKRYTDAKKSAGTGAQAEAALKLIPPNTSDVNALKAQISKVLGRIDITADSGQAVRALRELDEATRKPETTAQELQEKMDNVSKAIAEDFDIMRQGAQNAKHGTEEFTRETEEFIIQTNQTRGAAHGVAVNLDKVRQAGESAGETFGKLGQRALTAGEKMTYAVEAASSLTMGVTSAISVIRTFRDDDLSSWDKFSSLLMAASFTIPSLITSVKHLKEVMASSKGFQAILGAIGGGGVAIAIAAVAAAVTGLVIAWKRVKDQQPEAQLERAKDSAQRLNESLEKVKNEVNEINSLFDNYDNAVDALDKCTKGTKAWYDALEDVNDSALALLEKYPELYDTDENGKPKWIDTSGDYIKINEAGIEEANRKRQSQQYATQVALLSNKQEQSELNYKTGVEGLRVRANNEGIWLGSGGEADDDDFDIIEKLAENENVSIDDVRQALADHNYSNEHITNPETILELVKALQDLQAAVEEDVEKTEIAGQAYGKTVLANNEKVQKSDNKDYIEKIIGKKLIEYQDAAKQDLGSDEEILNKYKQEYDLDEDAKLNSKGEVVLNGEVITDMANMVAALTGDAVVAQANAEVDRLLEVFATKDDAKIGAAIYEATGDLGELNKAQIDAYKFSLGDDISEELQKQFDAISEVQVDKSLKSLSINLATGLQKTLGGEVGPVGAIIEDLGAEGAQLINSIDWSDWDAEDGFKTQLEQTGLISKITAEELDILTSALKESNNATKAFDPSAWSETVKETTSILEGLELGGIIEEEDLIRLKQIDTGFGDYFTKMADGTYMLTEDATRFYELVRQAQLNEIKEAIQSNEAKIKDLAEEAAAATNPDQKEALENEINALENDNTKNRIQGLSMARTSEEFDQMSSEEEFKALDKSSAAYKVLRNEIIETEEERGKEVDTLAELNKLRNKGEISNRGYAAGLTKLAKQYPQLNKKVNEYEEAIADFGKDSKEAASALNDLSNAMSAAQWKTAAQDLYDARYEMRELKAEYGSLAPEMKEYQAALQDQADALTALFGVEVSPAFVKEHANLIDEYLAGSQAAGYELMWLAEQQSGHIRTVVNECLAGAEVTADQITAIVTALDGLEFDVYGNAKMDNFMAVIQAAGISLTDVAKMLNALGSSHIQFDFEIDQKKLPGAIEKAKKLFKGQDKEQHIDGKNFDEWVKYYSMSITASGTVPKVNEFELSSVSGKNRGGGSKGTKKVASDEKERYHVVNKQIEDLQAKYDKAGKEKEKAFGPAKESAALTELGYLDQLIEKERQYKAEIEQYLATDKSALAKYGATFGENGEITNYDALMDKEIAKYNAAIEKAGTDEKAQENAEKAYDLFIKALETYEETYSAYLDKLATIQDLQNEKIDKELQNIQDKLDAKLDLEADQLKYLDYLIGKLDDEAYALADALVLLQDKTQPVIDQSDHYAQAWEELKRTAKENNDVWTQDMIDKLRELRDGLISTNEEIMELQKTIEEKVNEAIAECTDELDKQIGRFDTYTSILQNYNDIIDLSGKKFKDYGLMAKLSATMVENSINKISGTKDKLDTLKSAQAEAQVKLDLAENSSDQDQETIDYWKRTLEDINIEVENATAEMTSTWKEALQAASDAFENQVNLAIENFKKGLESFGDIDVLIESYERAEKASERYLEDFEKAYELSQLSRDITKAMNDTTSEYAKNELAELMEEINEKQKDGVKVSEYDLEVLQKKFELKQAELALEEAQNSMSQVRLTRDNEGNWSYQYTADQDKVDEALDEYETRLYEVAKLSDEYIDEMSKAIIDNQKEMYETLAGLRAEDFESEDEYRAKVQEILDFYNDQDAYLRGELAKAVNNAEEITTKMGTAYEGLSTTFTTVIGTMLGNEDDSGNSLRSWMDATDDMMKQAEEYFLEELPKAYNNWAQAVEGAMEAAGTDAEHFTEHIEENMEDIGDASYQLAEDIGYTADDMQNYIDAVMDAVWDWQEKYSQAIQDMIDENERLIESMMAVAAAQGAGEGNESITDYSREIATLIKSGKYDIDDEYIQELFRQRAEKDKEGKYVKNDRIKNLLAAYDDPSNSKHLDAKKIVDSVLEGKDIYFTSEYLAKYGFRTGGYTGAWGPEGKMAFVHEKELILNPSDTVNFLAGVNILREIAKMIDLQAANMAMPHGFTLPTSTSSGRQIDQNVHIQASFPGVQDKNEIEIALRSLVNEASQFVLE